MKLISYLSWISAWTILCIGVLVLLMMNQLVLQQRLVHQSLNATRILQVIQEMVIDHAYGVPIEPDAAEKLVEMASIHQPPTSLFILGGWDLQKRWEQKNQQLQHVITRFADEMDRAQGEDLMLLYIQSRPSIKENMEGLEKLYTEAIHLNLIILLGGMIFLLGLVIFFQVMVFRPLRLDVHKWIKKHFHRLFFDDLKYTRNKKRSDSNQ